MKIKTLVCNCRGTEGFRFADMNSLAAEIESEFDAAYALIHPQLCAESGKQLMEEVLHSAEDDPDTYVMVCACAEDKQLKEFKETLRETGFDSNRFVPMDIANATNDDILERIRERLNKVAERGRRH